MIDQLILTPPEQRFVDKLAELYPQQKGPACFEPKQIEESLSLNPEQVQTLLRMAKEYGFIVDVAESGHSGILAFNISVTAVAASRDIQRQKRESRDWVQQAIDWTKSHPVRAAAVLFILAIFFAVPFVNALFDLLAKFGWFVPPGAE
jgi:uncharacterized iron-regulated protein